MKKEIKKQINEILEVVTEAQKVRYNNEELKYKYLKELRDKLDKLYRLGYKDFNQREIQAINDLIGELENSAFSGYYQYGFCECSHYTYYYSILSSIRYWLDKFKLKGEN